MEENFKVKTKHFKDNEGKHNYTLIYRYENGVLTGCSLQNVKEIKNKYSRKAKKYKINT
jgi:metal-dependent hydrolase (beta-lactamase superfamily II)